MRYWNIRIQVLLLRANDLCYRASCSLLLNPPRIFIGALNNCDGVDGAALARATGQTR